MEFDSADPNNIVIVENFVSKEHLDMLYKYCYLINEWDSQSVSGTDKISTFSAMKKADPELYKIMEMYVERM